MQWPTAASNVLMLANLAQDKSPYTSFRAISSQLTSSETVDVTGFIYGLKVRFLGGSYEADVHEALKETAKKLAWLFNESFRITDRVETGSAWSWLGRVLVMRADGGRRIIKLFADYANELKPFAGTYSTTRRLGELASQYLAQIAPDTSVDHALNALCRLCKGRGASGDALVVDDFIRKVKPFTLSHEVTGLDIWAALYARLVVSSLTDVLSLPICIDNYVSWCRRDEEQRSWLLEAGDIKLIASEWPRAHIAEIAAEKREKVRLITCDEQGPLALVSRFVSKEKAFTEMPRIVEHGPFFTYIGIEEITCLFSDWEANWKKDGCSLENPPFKALMSMLEAGLSFKKMPDWNAFHRKDEWGFIGERMVSTHPLKWVELDILRFESEIWQLFKDAEFSYCERDMATSSVFLCKRHIYPLIINRLKIPSHSAYNEKASAIKSFIASEEASFEVASDGLELDPLHISWRDHLYAFKRGLIEMIERAGWNTKDDLGYGLSLASSALFFTSRPLWPNIQECFDQLRFLAMKEHEKSLIDSHRTVSSGEIASSLMVSDADHRF